MSTETVIETIIVGEVIREPGGVETVIERTVQTELVTDNIGPRGPMGPPGPAGQASGLEFTQAVPSDLWIITHGYNQQPLVAVKDSAGTEVGADVRHPSQGITHIAFERPATGSARLI